MTLPEPQLPATASEHENLPRTPMEMIAQAVTRNATPDTLERLLALQERYEKNEARKAYNKAIAAARGKIGPIFKNREVKFGTGKAAYRHETLDEIERAVVPILSEHGLSYRWGTRVAESRPDIVIVSCKVEHKDGYYEENSLSGPLDSSGNKNPIQAIGSSLTYLQRYTLKAALGLSATADDDGAGGAGEPVELVSEMEAAQLRRRILDVKQTEERFCAYYQIAKLEDLPAAKFDRAIAALKPQQPK